MIDCTDYCSSLSEVGFNFFTGVPDSLLKEFCACITSTQPPEKHIIAANEGGAVALAMGSYLATGKPAVVYMQNSGLGNTVNPIVSLAAPEVYGIPMLLLIGWRGEPGTRDEPQHQKQGGITLDMLQLMGIPTKVHPDSIGDSIDSLKLAWSHMRTHQTPYALVVKKNTFSAFTAPVDSATVTLPRREQAIGIVLGLLEPQSSVVATTGMASREVFELRAGQGLGHQRDMLTVGGMGHASQIALGIALAAPTRTVCCLDGDGAALMHMGGLAIIGSQRPANLLHVVLNNGAHDSVGGQPTAGLNINLPAIARACGYPSAASVDHASQIAPTVKTLLTGPGPRFLEVRVRKGARSDLGRPDRSPQENKLELMNFLQSP